VATVAPVTPVVTTGIERAIDGLGGGEKLVVCAPAVRVTVEDLGKYPMGAGTRRTSGSPG